MEPGTTERPAHTLVVTPWTPYPLVFGGAIRTYHMMRMLASFGDVSLLTLASWTDRDVRDHLGTFCREVRIVDDRAVDSSRGRARSLLTRRSFQRASFTSAALQRALDEMTAGGDIGTVLLEMSPMAMYRTPDQVVRVLDMANIEGELVARRAEVAGGLRGALLRLEAAKLRREEQRDVRSVDLVITTSDRETAIVQRWPGAPPVFTLANTIDIDFFSPRPDQRRTGADLAFVGATHVDANRDGVRFFMDEVFPLVEAERPDVTMTIVGGDPPLDIRRYAERPNVEVTGYVKDVRDRMARATVLVVPLRSGGGTRLKVLEGLSFGVPTVSTTIGAEGLDVVHDEHLLLADSAPDFACAVIDLLDDGQRRDRLTVAGRQRVEEWYHWSGLTDRLQEQLDAAAMHHAAMRSGRTSEVHD